MILVTMKNAVTSKAARQVLIAKKHSPQIMFAGGLVGVVASTVLACRATLELDAILEDGAMEHDRIARFDSPKYSEKNRNRDHAIIKARTARSLVRVYAPAIVVGGLSVAALTGSHVAITRRNVALTAAYSALDKGFEEYRARVKEELGDEADQTFRHGPIQQVEVLDTETGKLVKQDALMMDGEPSVYARFFDEYSSSWKKTPGYNQMFVQCQQNYANDMLNGRGHVFLNEVYDMLGLSRTKEGCVVGWVKGPKGHDNYIDFGLFDGDVFRTQRFVNGDETSILLDFNVDGLIYELI